MKDCLEALCGMQCKEYVQGNYLWRKSRPLSSFVLFTVMDFDAGCLLGSPVAIILHLSAA
jgi:hypothetical protein